MTLCLTPLLELESGTSGVTAEYMGAESVSAGD